MTHPTSEAPSLTALPFRLEVEDPESVLTPAITQYILRYWIGLFIVIEIAGILTLLNWFYQGQEWLWLYVAIGFFVLSHFVIMLLGITAHQQSRKLLQGASSASFLVTPSSLTVTLHGRATEYPWRSLYGLYVTPRVCLVMVNRFQFFALPTEQFPPRGEEALRGIAKSFPSK